MIGISELYAAEFIFNKVVEDLESNWKIIENEMQFCVNGLTCAPKRSISPGLC